MSEYFVGTTGSNSQTTFEALSTSEVLDDLQLNTGNAPTFSGLFLNSTGTGANNTIFSVDGSNGRLFGVTDEVTGTVFSVNDAAGLPILEVESTADYDKITIGEYGSDLLVLSGQTTAEVTGSQIATQSWISDQGFSADTNFYLTGIEKSSNTLTYKVKGTGDVSYTFGSNAFNSTTIPSAANNATITISAGTNLGGGGDFTTDQSANETITINHDTFSRSDTTSSESLSFGGSFDAVDGITADNGHITAENTVTYTLPSLTSGDITGALGYTPVTLESDGSVEAEEFIGDLRGAVSFTAKAGEALSAGEAVYISGIDGNSTVVAKADADDSNKMPAFGVAGEDANANANVSIVNFGRISNLDTSDYSEGDELFISTTAGLLTGIAPAGESAALQKMAKVTRSHASSGSITVMGAGRSNAVPNLNEGRLFVGNSSNQAVADGTIHVDIANSRVGIGTTSPNEKLEVDGNIRLTDFSDDIQFGGTTNMLSYNQWLASASGGMSIKNSATASTGHIAFETSTGEKVRILRDGSVGIGTTSPLQLLHLKRDATNPYVRISSGAFTGLDVGQEVSVGNAVFNLRDNKDIRFLINGSDVVRVKNDGNVGIGTVSPASLLHLSAGTSGDAILTIEADTDNNNENDNPYIHFKQDGGINAAKLGLEANSGTTFTNSLSNAAYFGHDTSGSPLQLYTDGAARLTILSNGNVGIGTTSPSYKLEVDGTFSSNSLWTDSNAITYWGSGTTAYGILTWNTGYASVKAAAGNDLRLGGNNSSTHMAIDTSGNVGIGDTTPSYKLDVAGDIRATGDLRADDDVFIAGNTLRFTNDAASAYIQSVDTLYIEADSNINDTGGKPIIFRTAGTTKMTIAGDGDVTIDNDLIVSGDLTVSGTTTTINSTTISVDDKNIELGSVGTPTDTTADGGGITLKGATDKTINWVNSTSSWTSNQTFSAPNLTLTSLSNQSSEATALMINGSNVVGTRELGSNAFNSTSYLPLAGGTLSGSVVGTSFEFDKLVYDWTAGSTVPIIELKGATSYGIFYQEGSPDQMHFSTSGNTTYELSFSSSGITHKGNTIWHAGNDGSGSGLDADLLDGNHASAFATASHNHTLNSLSNVTITSNTSGEILKWNGSAWVNNTLSEAGICPTAGSTSLTTVGTITSGEWNGSVIASAYLDADTAHLSGTQTFSGTKTFSTNPKIASTGSVSLSIDKTNATTTTNLVSYVSFQAGGSEKGWVGFGSGGNSDLTVKNSSGKVVLNGSSGSELGTVVSGTWNGSVIASAYLDSDTAHLSGTQTFSGQKTFDAVHTYINNNLTVYGGLYVSSNIYHAGDTDTRINLNTNSIKIEANSESQLVIDADGIVVNELGNDNNFRIEGSGEANALFVQGSDGNVGIHTNSPDYELHVIGTASFTDTVAGAYFEENASHESLKSMRTGFILVMDEDGELVPCTKENDATVFGVAKKGYKQPIIMGAEPIKVTGPIKVGDFITTSNVEGHGMKAENPQFGTIIAQAMESGDGESYNIKAMIRKM